MNQKNIAIIPARSGSKRIPNKNIKHFLGKPVIAYSIETAIKTGLFDEIMVSTDSEQIMKIALKYGAKVPFLRSPETAGDFATLSDVVGEVLTNYDDKFNLKFDNICCLLATAPLVKPGDLITSYNLLLKSGLDAVFPIVKYDYPIQRALKLENQKVRMIWPENKNKRSQDLEPAYHDAGLFYWIKNNVFINQKTLWPQQTAGMEISRLAAQDIDTPEDWILAELKYKLRNNEQGI